MEHRTLEKPIDYSLYSGKPVKLIRDAMECATLRIDGLDFRSWHRQNWYIKQQYLAIQDMEYYLRQFEQQYLFRLQQYLHL